jgi:hypothetical protein
MIESPAGLAAAWSIRFSAIAVLTLFSLMLFAFDFLIASWSLT